MLLTVFTPTYNRGYILHRLYKSLCDLVDSSFDHRGVVDSRRGVGDLADSSVDSHGLEDYDFEWLVVDDGSTDNTGEIIKGFQQEKRIPVRYFKKTHGGKHAAYNVGLTEARGEFFFNIDSDDCISVDCLHHLKTIAHSIRNNNRLAGYISMKSDRKGNILGAAFDWNLHVASFEELQQSGYKGEYSIIFKTETARRYPFPVIDGEHYMPENVIYNRMRGYKFFVDNNVMTVCEYLPDGLSSNWNRLRYENPRGFMLYHQEKADHARRLGARISNIISYNHYSHISKMRGNPERYTGRHPWMVTLLHPLSRLMGIRDIRMMRNLRESMHEG